MGKQKPEISKEPPPPDAKQITRTTIERYQQPIQDEQPDGDGAEKCSECDELERAAVHTKKSLPTYHEFQPTDLDDADEVATVSFVEDEPKPSPLDSLLSSLKGVGEITVYIIRKPDPIGLTFREPCQIAHTAGDLPFDESFTSKEAIELAVQSVYGGGKYQLQIRNNGDYVTAWTTLIADPRKQTAPPQFTPPQQTETARTAREELREVLELAKDIAGIRGRTPEPSPPALPPVSQVQTVQDTVETFKSLKGLFEDDRPAGGERNYIDSATNLIDKLTNSQLVINLGNLFGQALLDHIRTAGAANGTRPPAADSPGGPAQSKQPALSPAPPPPPPTVTEPPAAPSAEDIAASAAIEVAVRELQGYDESEDEEQDVEHVRCAADALMKLPPDTVKQLLAVPAALLLYQLSQMNPAWSAVAELPHAMQFVDALKGEINDRLEAAAKTNGQVVDLNAAKQSRVGEGK